MKFSHWWLGLPGLVYDVYKGTKKKSSSSSSNTSDTSDSTDSTDEDSSTAQNVYNYYTNESENGNTLFNSKQKTRRTLFGSEVA